LKYTGFESNFASVPKLWKHLQESSPVRKGKYSMITESLKVVTGLAGGGIKAGERRAGGKTGGQ
jgi:hypothetical protein